MNTAEDFRKNLLLTTGQDGEKIEHTLYDTLTYPRDLDESGVLRFFKEPQGVNRKRVEDTNMFVSSALPNLQAFVVEGIAFTVMGDPVRVPWRVLFTGHYEFMLGSKIYSSGSPLLHRYSVMGSALPIAPSLFIGQGHSFSLSVAWVKPWLRARPFRLQARLQGQLYRPVV